MIEIHEEAPWDFMKPMNSFNVWKKNYIDFINSMNKGPVKVHKIHEGAPWDFMKLMNSIWNGRIHQKRLHEIHEYSFHWKSKKLAAEIPRLAAEFPG